MDHGLEEPLWLLSTSRLVVIMEIAEFPAVLLRPLGSRHSFTRPLGPGSHRWLPLCSHVALAARLFWVRFSQDSTFYDLLGRQVLHITVTPVINCSLILLLQRSVEEASVCYRSLVIKNWDGTADFVMISNKNLCDNVFKDFEKISIPTKPIATQLYWVWLYLRSPLGNFEHPS